MFFKKYTVTLFTSVKITKKEKPLHLFKLTTKIRFEQKKNNLYLYSNI